jgi:hypothetical protein
VILAILGGLLLIATGVFGLGMGVLIGALVIIYCVTQAIPQAPWTFVTKLYITIAVIFLGVPALCALFYSKYPTLWKALIARSVYTERRAADVVRPDDVDTYVLTSAWCDRALAAQGDELEKILGEAPGELRDFRVVQKTIAERLSVAQKVKTACDELRQKATLAKQKPASPDTGKPVWQMPNIQIPNLKVDVNRVWIPILVAVAALLVTVFLWSNRRTVFRDAGGWIIMLLALGMAFIIITWFLGSLAGQPYALMPTVVAEVVSGEKAPLCPHGIPCCSQFEYQKVYREIINPLVPLGTQWHYTCWLWKDESLGPIPVSGVDLRIQYPSVDYPPVLTYWWEGRQISSGIADAVMFKVNGAGTHTFTMTKK